MHHSPMPSPELSKYREQIERMEGNLGATKRFPEGKLTKDDEGEIRFAVIQHEGKIVLDFNQPVAWVGMNAEQAISLGSLLIAKGKEYRKRR